MRKLDRLNFLKDAFVHDLNRLKAQSFWDKPDTDISILIAIGTCDFDVQTFSAVHPQEFEQWKKDVAAKLREDFMEFDLDLEFTYTESDHIIEYKSWVDDELSTEDLLKLQDEILKAIPEIADECYEDIQENGIFGPDGLLGE